MSKEAPRVLGEEVIQYTEFGRRVRQFVAGWWPKLGILHNGYTGKETIIEKDIITPIARFGVDYEGSQKIYQMAMWPKTLGQLPGEEC